ncbi:MAG: DNA-3-methyladenine glycosylase [Balneolaceae bacterium]|nr:DNA-3-methyladenine glycosylase [Balneolaceae bacterium]
MIPDTDKLLTVSFYSNPDVVDASRQLLGKVLCSSVNGSYTSGIIIETEAYCGRDDRACHANNGLRTDRTEVMYGDPGHAYIYLCYGIHHLFNVVTNRNGLADAVLIRSVQPLDGIDIIKERRGNKRISNLADGPGKLTQALGITTSLNKTDLSKPPVWIEDREISVKSAYINASPRIGVDYAGEDAKKPWRFTINPSLL